MDFLSLFNKSNTSVVDPNTVKEDNNLSDSDSTSESDSEDDMGPKVVSMEPYQEGTNFEEYLERFETLLELHEIEDEVMKSKQLVAVGGTWLYSKLKFVCKVCPKTLRYDRVKPLIETYLKPKSLEVLERAKFNSLTQKHGEDITAFALSLREYSQSCNFGDNLDSQLRDRFIVGLKNESMRKSIIRSDPRNFDVALGLAQTFELSEGASCSNVESIHKFQKKFTHKDRQKYNGYQKQYKKNNNNRQCHRCGRFFHKGECPAKDWMCYTCKKKGHTSKMCHMNQGDRQGQNGGIKKTEMDQFKLGKFHLNNLKNSIITKPPVYVQIKLNNINIKCEIDTGACMGVMSYYTYEKYFSRIPLSIITDKCFTMADDTKCDIVGLMSVKLNNDFDSHVIVIRSKKCFPPLVGRTWLDILYPNWRNIFTDKISYDLELKVNNISDNNVIKIKEEYSEIFKERKSTIRGVQVHLQLKDNVSPVFLKPSIVPYALRENVEKQLHEMVLNGVLKKVDSSNWASQIVLSPKKNGEIRLCCNYKRTINPCLEDKIYPIPRIDDTILTLHGNKFFTIIDLAGAYLQLQLDETSQELTTINTHLGLFQYTRLPFGVKTAPSIFQGSMDKMLHGLEGVSCYFDDILIAGPTLEVCKIRTYAVLTRLRENNVRANFDKCQFFVTEVEYLGHKISKEGVEPIKLKVDAIMNASRPKDLTSLRSFIGMLNFYSKFLPNLQSKLHPLYRLLEKNAQFKWSENCEQVFNECKVLVCQSPVLSFYDPSKPLTVVCDAGPYGVGGILNIVEKGEERPVFMISASLSQAEKNYSQLHREALAIVFSIRKFHKFIYGHKIIVYTDCKSLVSILSGKKDLCTVINSRFLRWILFLQNYDIEFQFRPSDKTKNADALSRLPINEPTGVEEMSINVFNCFKIFNECESELINKELISKTTQNHPLCKSLYEMINVGWPVKEKVEEDIKLFYKFRDSLDIQDGCVFYGNRIFIPPELRSKVLSLLHKEHIGIVKSKQLARSAIWWPKIDVDIEDFVKTCKPCQVHSGAKNINQSMSWSKTTYPFERVHIDHFFIRDLCFLIIVDDFTGWVDVQLNKNTSSKCVIESLKKFFSIFGFPTVLVSDNVSGFKSHEFKQFCHVNGIIRKNSPEYSPRSNGLAERGVGIVKNSLKKYLFENENKNISLESKILNYLFKSHTTPMICGKTPCELLFSYKVQTNLSHLTKQVQSDLSNSQNKDQWLKSKTNCQKNRKMKSSWKYQHQKKTCFWNKSGRDYHVRENIYYYHRLNRIWVEAKIVRKISPLIYLIRFKNGHEIQTHVQSIKSRKERFVPLIYEENQNNNLNINETISSNQNNNETISFENNEIIISPMKLRPRNRIINYKD